MSAAADLKDAAGFLTRPLPAYVTYVEDAHVRFDAIRKAESSTITVRTKDGKIVRGKAATFSIEGARKTTGSIVTNPAFDVLCYSSTAAKTITYEGNAVEAIALTDHCQRDESDGDFDALYVDPSTHEPVAAVGSKHDDPVDVHIEQHFARTGEYVLPSALNVRVKGSGFMFWLDVDAHVTFGNYTFSEALP